MANSGVPANSTIGPTNPLYLHLSDNPGMNLISKQFDGERFGSWKKSMSIALSAKNKLEFVKGNIVKPIGDPPQLSAWQRCNDMITSWILNALTKEIADSVLYANSVCEIWTELEERYGQSNGVKLYQLQKEMVSVAQAVEALLKYEQDQRLVQFIMGLNSDYNAIRGNILLMRPLPTVSQAYGLLIHEERQRGIQASSPLVSEHASLNVNSHNSFKPGSNIGGYKGRFDNKKLVICEHCKKPGHSANKCYRLVGFPKDFKLNKAKKIAAHTSTGEDSTGNEENITNQSTDTLFNQFIQFLNTVQVSNQGCRAADDPKTHAFSAHMEDSFFDSDNMSPSIPDDNLQPSSISTNPSHPSSISHSAIPNPNSNSINLPSPSHSSSGNVILGGNGASESADDDLPSDMTCASYLKLPLMTKSPN
ncbi:unnamed protein product [Cuscuta campestris]|uniref:Retrotransposon Copia-like N-terminal domain-containing protein n=1 Tax=Cuscuta campestris TaxID=132261 RepID=A0A484NEM0_9ASTE|nr:unnamed protein product [Cuscuta campestris]